MASPSVAIPPGSPMDQYLESVWRLLQDFYDQDPADCYCCREDEGDDGEPK